MRLVDLRPSDILCGPGLHATRRFQQLIVDANLSHLRQVGVGSNMDGWLDGFRVVSSVRWLEGLLDLDNVEDVKVLQTVQSVLLDYIMK